MKICVVGAGAIGGLLGVKLAQVGEVLTLIARGAHLDAIRRDGLRLMMADGTESVATEVGATSNMRENRDLDIVITEEYPESEDPVRDPCLRRTLLHPGSPQGYAPSFPHRADRCQTGGP